MGEHVPGPARLNEPLPALGLTPGSGDDMARDFFPFSDELPKAFGGNMLPAACCLRPMPVPVPAPVPVPVPVSDARAIS
jgi:hypothetical protein